MIKSFERKKVIDIKAPLSSHPPSFDQNSKHFSISLSKGREFLVRISFLFFICLFSFFSVGLMTASAPIFLYPREVEAQFDEEKAQLEKQLAEIEQEIAQQEKILATTQQQKATLQNKINQLKQQASKLALQIKSTNVNLNYLNVQIDETTASIAKTTNSINQTKDNLASLLQSLYQLKQTSLVEMLLGTNQLSEFFDYANALNSLQEKIQNNITELNNLRVTLDNQNQKLSSDREATQSLLAMQLLQKDKLAQTQKEQSNLLDITKGNEAKYQQILQASRQKANEIRSRIYDLLGVKTQVTFGEALDIANWVSSRLNIRPAFLLAILTQESNLGKNVGTCNRPGDPYEKSWQVVMKPDSRDAFVQITKELGLDPNTTPISCPINDPKRGMIAGKNSWGGAMGPAQFMPKTWLAYKDKVAQTTGHTTPNPWDVRDSFTAAALYLANWGATQKTSNAEWRAAMIYFSGSTNTRYRFYGDNVMAIASKYEQDIAALQQVATR
ncbi:MAG: lytic murein transglycosylase [Minisyncoccia bacterium]